ncbi:hypothetical protein D3C71_1751650 [compost metagenome]
MWVQPMAPAPMAITRISRLYSGCWPRIGITMPAALIIATVAEPTAKCMIPATNQARMIGLSCVWFSTSASALPMPLPTSMSLKAPPAPMISKMPARGGKQRWVRLSRPAISRPRRKPSAQ